MEIARGIGLGIGVTLGIILTIAVIGLVVTAVLFLYKLSLRRSFTVDMFKNYQEYLLENEMFEEITDVNLIIEKLKKNEKPKELLQKYWVEVDSYFYWAPTYDGGERLVIRSDKRIRKHNKKVQKNIKPKE